MGSTSWRKGRKECNRVRIVVFMRYRGYIMTRRCFATDVIERYLYGRLPQWQSTICRGFGEVDVKGPDC
jgi:hypothetical protein